MALDKEAAQKILAEIDREELAQLGCELTSIPSPTGKEKAVAEFILAWFATNGLKAVRQDVEADRPNAVGILKGTGTGLSLGFNGHTDTSFTGTDEDLRMVRNIEPAADLKGRIVGNKVQGLGISNMKGGVAAFMIAGKALKKSGIKLKGDVILAAVVGEISRTPIGLWQTQDYRGEGAGTRHLLTHGMHSDYAVCADGSDMNIVWTQTGVVQVKITTFGKAEAAWGTSRSAYPMGKDERHREDDQDYRRGGAVGGEVRREIYLQVANWTAAPQGQHRRDRRWSALPAELLPGSLLDLRRCAHASASATGHNQV